MRVATGNKLVQIYDRRGKTIEKILKIKIKSRSYLFGNTKI